MLALCSVLCFVTFSACIQFGNPTNTPSTEPPAQTDTIGDDDPTPPTSEEVSDVILSEDGKTVTGLKDKSITQLTISSSYNGITVTGIGVEAFLNCTLASLLPMQQTLKRLIALTGGIKSNQAK